MPTIAKTNRHEELIRRFTSRAQEMKQPTDERETWLMNLAWQIGGIGPKGIRVLLSTIATADDRRLRAILLGLQANAPDLPLKLQERVSAAALALLSDSRPLIVAEAIDVLAAFGHKNSRSRFIGLLEHPSPYVVGSVLRYLARLFPKRAIPILEEALNSPEPIVRQNAIDELDELSYMDALPKIKRHLKDPDRWVRQAARSAVKNLETRS